MDVNQYRDIYAKKFLMKIVLSQISLKQDYKKNLTKILSVIINNKFDILVFPEFALTSYNLKKAISVSNKKILNSLKKIQKKLKKDQIVIIATLIYQEIYIYNAAVMISKEKMEYYFKNTLTKYDSKYLNSSTDNLIFKFNNFKIGILICRDQNNIQLIKKYKKEKCEIIFQLSAHYYKTRTAIKKMDKNIAMPIVRDIDTNSLFCKVNTVGDVGKKVSLGNSMIVDGNGYILRKANQSHEEIIKFKIKDTKWL